MELEVAGEQLADVHPHAGAVRGQVGRHALEAAVPRAMAPGQALEPHARGGARVRDEIRGHAARLPVGPRRDERGVANADPDLKRSGRRLLPGTIRSAPPRRKTPCPVRADESHRGVVERHVEAPVAAGDQAPRRVVDAHFVRREHRAPVAEAHPRLDRAKAGERVAADVAQIQHQVTVFVERAVQDQRQLARHELGAIHEIKHRAHDPEHEHAHQHQAREARELAHRPANGLGDVLDHLLDLVSERFHDTVVFVAVFRILAGGRVVAH